MPAELPGVDATGDDLGDQLPDRNDHFLEVEPGQLGEVGQFRMDQPGEPGLPFVLHSAPEPFHDLAKQGLAGAGVLPHHLAQVGDRGADLVPDHGAKERLLRLEVEVERSLADTGLPGDVFQPRSGIAPFTKEQESGRENFGGSLFGPALPARRAFIGVVQVGLGSHIATFVTDG